MCTEITYINARRPVLPKIIHLFYPTWLFYGASFISPFYFASALPEKARCYPVNSRDADVQRSYNWPFASSPTRWSSTISRRWSLSRPGDGETAFEKRERHDPVSVESRHSRSRIIRKQYNGIGFELRTYIGFIPAVNKDQRLQVGPATLFVGDQERSFGNDSFLDEKTRCTDRRLIYSFISITFANCAFALNDKY